MPYSTPGDVYVPPAPVRQRRHIRSSSAAFSFSDEHGSGTFAPLPSLPRRRSHIPANGPIISANLTATSTTTSTATTTSAPPIPKRTGPVFHFRNDDDDDEEDDSDDVPPGANVPALKLRPGNSLRLNTENLHSPVPFPRSSPLPSPTKNPLYNVQSPRASLPRTNSHPILLSNGKPLKSSLKSSSSSPVIASTSASLPPATRHLRARSAPSTPRPASPDDDDDNDSVASCASYSPLPTPKNVHFAENDTLESVCVFSRSARPASVSSLDPTADDTETETEVEAARTSSFPFPRVPAPRFELDTAKTSPVPALTPPTYANVHLEAISLAIGPGGAPVLAGTLLARNIAYEKSVALRFTLDEWQTTSEVLASYAASLPSLPPALRAAMPSAPTVGDVAAQDHAWDRFTFSIRLADYAHRLDTRTVWLVARYTASGAGEWWDNNSGQNYRIGFRPATPAAVPSLPTTRRPFSVSAPSQLSLPPTFPTPPTVTPPTPPASATNSPVATATAARLAKFTLANYAAPRPPPDTPPTPPLTPQRENALQLSSLPSAMVGGHPATLRGALGLGFGAHAGTHGGPVTLHWPWGGLGNGGAPAAVQGSIDHLEKREKAKEEEAALPTPPSSTASSSPASSFSRVLDRARAGVNGSPAPSPRGSPSDSGDEDGGSPSPLDTVGSDSDSVYRAFVKQWCFAQGPPPTVGTGGGVVVG